MRILVNIIRVIVGVLFVFSGLVKANDPHGLSYKMQEFFERWAADGFLPSLMNGLHQFSLEFSIIMIALEIVVGVGLLLGIWKYFFGWITFILMIFFTWLTGYAALSGKIATCGCFGDCLPLSSMQSFIKDVVLIVFSLIILLGLKFIKPVFSKPLNIIILIITVIFSLGMQWYALRHLPLVDCLPFKKGNNILELREMPANAIPDKKEYRFIYEKEGRQKEFTIKDLPDSTWTFISRNDVIIEKGSNNEPPIKDFILTTSSGTDTTQAILGVDALYYLFYVTAIKDSHHRWEKEFKRIYEYAQQSGRSFAVVTADPDNAKRFFNEELKLDIPVLSLDATAFKTAARTNPELYLMHGPVVKDKWGSADLDKALKE